MNRRIGMITAAAAVALLALAGCSSGAGGSARSPSPAGTSPSATAQASASVDLRTANTALGAIVVNARGLTVYVFDKDTPDSGKSVCSGQCATIWPAVTATSATPSVEGVTGTVGSIPALAGGRQVTLNGLPLYTFSGDASAGDVKGQGFMGIWWVVGPNGTKMTSTASTGSGMYSK